MNGALNSQHLRTKEHRNERGQSGPWRVPFLLDRHGGSQVSSQEAVMVQINCRGKGCPAKTA